VGITTVYVTHDQEEAMAISDQIAVMKSGEIQQVGKPKELYHRPSNEFVATFIGRTNILDAQLQNEDGNAEIVFQNGYILPMPHLAHTESQAVRVSVRPEEFQRTENNGDTMFAVITDSIYLGLNTEYIMELDTGEHIQVIEESSFEEDLKNGDKVNLHVN